MRGHWGSGDCEDFCGKAEECLGPDNMDELGGVEDCVNGCSGNTEDWKWCMLDCDTGVVCENWANCVNSCGGFTVPYGDDSDGDED